MFSSSKSFVLLAIATILLAALRSSFLSGGFRRGEGASSLEVPRASAPTGQDAPAAKPAQHVRTRQITDPLPPVADVPVLSRPLAEGKIADEEFVMGVTIGSESRAYPLNMLADPRRELLNDTLGGKPIAVAWCDQCQCPRTFERDVDGRTLTLRLSGETLDSNMLMRDVETGSEWVQLLGSATAGPLAGKRLRPIPALWTDWKTWRSKHPETTVLMLERVVPIYRHVPQYAASPQEREYFGKLQWGLADDGRARSWPFAQLAKREVVNDELNGNHIVILFSQRDNTVTAFDRTLDGKLLSFKREAGKLIDEGSRSVWDPVLGTAVEGPLKGKTLKSVAGVVSMLRKWLQFHPETEMWKAPPP